MATALIPAPFPDCELEDCHPSPSGLMLVLHAQRPDAPCPGCAQISAQVHSYYQRHPADLPISNQAVQLVLRLRRFRCHNPQCPRRTFSEPLPGLLPAYARRTNRLMNG